MAPPEPEGSLLLNFEEPSAVDSDAEDPGWERFFSVPESSLELVLEANGFKLLNHPAWAGEAATSTPKPRNSFPMVFTIGLQRLQATRPLTRYADVLGVKGNT